ncbi:MULTISPECIES: cytochrome c-type biogenesis protein [Marinobacter]|jgi:cytochrome c-type biogenesis protein CcmH|uniref:Cytochrome c-type biogenesis protein n=1 Tax=Marinobacter manganoxydans MnI7-9 TaxID=1094979 RepID=G6YTK0_9GAMM|nr:cytochrome c-type biogenesis protein [Marinobacter manganoxydans]EHJ04511.1 cytochrome C biogenesis protein [Marinobacter manganoxydans MnI7-9]|tara:strand:- start:1876 stop:2349 length:474 start_codon:yes stop_codon:yes gene_type:complete
MVRIVYLMLVLLLSGAAAAEVADVYDFSDRAQEQRYQNLIAELRCPKCQNQNIADSNAPISKDMRDAVYRMMKDGASNEEIVESLVGRFGEFVRYKPEFDSRTFLLWATPAITVLGGLLVVAGVVIRSRRAGPESPALSAEEKARVDKMLADRDRWS